MHEGLISAGIVLLVVAGAIFGSPGRAAPDPWMMRFPDTSTARWIYPAVFAAVGVMLIALALTVV